MAQSNFILLLARSMYLAAISRIKKVCYRAQFLSKHVWVNGYNFFHYVFFSIVFFVHTQNNRRILLDAWQVACNRY